jgi:hypothetical protein
MDKSEEKSVSRPGDSLYVELSRLEWAKALSDETLTAIVNTAEYVEFHNGEVVIEFESEIKYLWSLITG